VFSHSAGRSRGAEGAAALSARTVPVTEVSCTSPVGGLAGRSPCRWRPHHGSLFL